MHKIAIGAVHFHTVESGVHGIARGIGEVVHGGLDLFGAQLAWNQQLVHAVLGVHGSARGDGAGGDRRQPVSQQIGVTDPAGV
jgi:hypothetical protein